MTGSAMRLEGWSRLHRNSHGRPQAPHRTVAKRNVPAMRAGDVAGDCEAQSGAAFILVAGVVEPQEWLEHPPAPAERNAWPVIIDGHRQVAMVAQAGDRNRVGVPCRVGDEVA